jgi:LmbE family N-acetylglucosaminyl deacetylase
MRSKEMAAVPPAHLRGLWNNPCRQMNRYDRIYLSPHLDDALFSCGGRIHQEVAGGLSVLIVTVATAPAPARRSRYAARFHRRAGLGEDAMQRRRQEDLEAARRLGAETLHLGLPDAIYRVDPLDRRTLYPRWTALVGRPRTRDPLGPLLRRGLAELPESELLILPFAIGGHVDHRLTREAAEATCAGRRLAYWEDFPYLAYRLRPGPRPGRGWQAELIELEALEIEARCRAMAAYESQVRAMFGSEARMRRLVERTVGRLGGERYWRRD